MRFSEQIRKIRKDNNLTQEQLSLILNVSRQTISSWENNRNLPDLEMVVEIAKKFNLSLDQLILGGKDMEEKLIKDGSDNAKKRLNAIMMIIGFALLCIGATLLLLKGMTVEYIDSDGILHENFFMLPIGFLFLFSGVMAFSAVGLRNVASNFRAKDDTEKQ